MLRPRLLFLYLVLNLYYFVYVLGHKIFSLCTDGGSNIYKDLTLDNKETCDPCTQVIAYIHC